MRKISFLSGVILLVALILSGCGKLERKGTEPVNIHPLVFFANVPPESTEFSISPLIYWYGTDKDGYITAYQYAVIREDSISEVWGGLDSAKKALKRVGPDSASWINNIERTNIFGAHVTAEKGHQRNVRMYAEIEPDSFTAQHIFLRAVDNKGGISEIKTRMYWRNNHAPQCSIDVDSDFALRNFYCLPETIQTWQGIEIKWVGSDTLDYPDERKQPEFYFRWELWGPYADDSLHVDYDAPVDSSLDSVEIGGEWFYDEWTLNKFHIFKNLENYSENDSDYGYGYYQLRVWSRDDAFVSSEDTATTFLRILKPLFRFEEPSRRTILVLDHTKYGGSGAAETWTDVRPFYDTALVRIDDLYDNYSLIDLYDLDDQLPSEDSLSRYDLVIVLNLGKNAGISEESYCKYKNYLNVGGRLWIMGLNNFSLMALGKQYLEEKRTTDPCTFAVGTAYLGLEGVFYPQFTSAEPDRLEFMGAEPFGSWELPLLELEPDKAKKLRFYDPTNPGKNYPVNGIPHVCYDVLSNTRDFNRRAPLHRRLYSFVSRHGIDSETHLKPCATTYIGPTFRTAEFTFPLNLMKDGDEENPGAHETFRRMVEWLLEDLPEP